MCVVGPLPQLCEDERNRTGNEATVGIARGAARDGERLAGARLTVGEHRTVNAIEGAEHNIAGDALKHL